VDLELFGPRGAGIAQVKRWRRVPIGRPLLQQFYGEMTHRRFAYGYFLTTSRFTVEALEWSRGKGITLLDGPGLERLAQLHFAAPVARTSAS